MVWAGQYGWLAWLYRLGVVLDVIDCFGMTPLHWAVVLGDFRAVWFLLSHGVDVRYVDSYGRTPLHLACSFGSRRIIRMLLIAGSPHDAYDNERLLPRDYLAFGDGAYRTLHAFISVFSLLVLPVRLRPVLNASRLL